MTPAELKILQQLINQEPPEPPLPNYAAPYEQQATSYRGQADKLEQEASTPYPQPKGAKENVVAALRAAMESFGRYGQPGGHEGAEARRQKQFSDENTERLNRAKDFRGQAQSQQQLGATVQAQAGQLHETKKLREIQARTEGRLQQNANKPSIDNVGPGSHQIVRDADGKLLEELVVPDAPTPKNQGYRDKTDSSGRITREYFDQADPSKVTSSADLGVKTSGTGLQRVNTIDENGNAVIEFVRPGEGNQYDMAPTADTRNRKTALKKAGPVLDSISDLSERINTGAGLMAKAVGEVAKVKAKANYDDDVAEYEALVSGFTPLIARAVGHTGVLTEQDVQSVRKMFPAPGDSKTLRDRKVARLNFLMAEIAEAGSNDMTNSTQSGTPAGGGYQIIPGGAVERLMKGQ